MDNGGKKCRKTKLVPREINESDEEIIALQVPPSCLKSYVGNTTKFENVVNDNWIIKNKIVYGISMFN